MIIIEINNKRYTYDNFDDITSLNNFHHITYIDCSNNRLLVLPQLPNSLQILYCSYNQLTILPQLPNSLQTLNCTNNQLTTLPQLPNSLQYLYCEYNQLTTLPQLPNSLIYFNCINNLFKFKYTRSNYKYNNIKNKKYIYNKQLVNDIQCDYLDSSYHPKNRFCKEKLLFSFNDLFDDDF